MKYEGSLNGMPVYSSPDCPPDTVYMINPNYFHTPTTKKGKPDMRFGINKLFYNVLVKPRVKIRNITKV